MLASIMLAVLRRFLDALIHPIVGRPSRRLRRYDHFATGILLPLAGLALLLIAIFGMSIHVIGAMGVGVLALLAIVCVTMGILSLQTAGQLRELPPPGFCRTCGYDLRATPDRCPECGAVPDEAERHS